MSVASVLDHACVPSVADSSALQMLIAAQKTNEAANNGRALARYGSQIAAACARRRITRLWAASETGQRLVAAALIAAPDTLTGYELGDGDAAVAIIEAACVTPLALDQAASLLKRAGVARAHGLVAEVHAPLPTPNLDSLELLGATMHALR